MNINEATRHIILSNFVKYSVDDETQVPLGVERIQTIYGERSS